MKRLQGIVESINAPATNVLWLNKGTAKYFSNGRWVTLAGDSNVSWDNIADKPSFATVATSGKYSDLSGTPTAVSEKANGLMTVSLLQKLNGIEAQANNYTLPAAGESIGGVKQMANITKLLGTEELTEVIAKINTILDNMVTSGQMKG